MTETHRTLPYETDPIQPEDLKCGFKCGNHPLDEFFARHALPNDRAGVGKTYVLRARPSDWEKNEMPKKSTTTMPTYDRMMWPALQALKESGGSASVQAHA